MSDDAPVNDLFADFGRNHALSLSMSRSSVHVGDTNTTTNKNFTVIRTSSRSMDDGDATKPPGDVHPV